MKSKKHHPAPIPSYLNHPEGLFESVDQYRNVVASIIKGLAKAAGQDQRRETKSYSYLFDQISVEFSATQKSEEIYLDHLNSVILLRAPKSKSESCSSLKKRRMEYLALLLREVEAMKTIGVSQIFLALTPEGREVLTR